MLRRAARQQEVTADLQERVFACFSLDCVFVPELELLRLLRESDEIEMQAMGRLLKVIHRFDALGRDEDREDEILIATGDDEIDLADLLIFPAIALDKFMLQRVRDVTERHREIFLIFSGNYPAPILPLFEFSEYFGESVLAAFAHHSSSLSFAESRVREALSYHTPGSRLDALIDLFHTTPAPRRDAVYATLAARLVLAPPKRREAGEEV